MCPLYILLCNSPYFLSNQSPLSKPTLPHHELHLLIAEICDTITVKLKTLLHAQQLKPYGVEPQLRWLEMLPKGILSLLCSHCWKVTMGQTWDLNKPQLPSC